MVVIHIIPSILRNTLLRTLQSIEGYYLIETGGEAGENRNKGLKKAKQLNPDWVLFIDDDDYYLRGYTSQLDDAYDIIVLRMEQDGRQIPDETNELRFTNVGINIALNMNRIGWENIPDFDEGEGEDWRFLEKLLKKYTKVKITEAIYYVAERRSYNQ